MPATARSVSPCYQGERDERAGVRAARSRYGAREYRQLAPAAASSGPGPVIALSRVVRVQARLAGRVSIPISAATSASSCSMPTSNSSWPAEPPTLDAAHARPPAGWSACRDDYESLLALLLEP